MLDKSVCKKCINKLHKSHSYNAWNKDDEMLWIENSSVMCPPVFKKGRAAYNQITDPPHEKCPYILEHLIKTQKE